MTESIRRIGECVRWADVVIHRGMAKWVEVAADRTADSRGQIEQVLRQIDDTLPQVGSSRDQILQILIFLANLDDISILNDVWDAWVPPGHAPVRACVQAGLGQGCRVEMVIEAATSEH